MIELLSYHYHDLYGTLVIVSVDTSANDQITHLENRSRKACLVDQLLVSVCARAIYLFYFTLSMQRCAIPSEAAVGPLPLAMWSVTIGVSKSKHKLREGAL
jgi:hypothetical protein